MTIGACAICVVSFIGLHRGVPMTWEQTARWGYYPSSAVWDGKPWALITSAFVHFAFWHLAFNLCALWILGGILEDAIGAWKWLAFFVGAAWVSSAVHLLVDGGLSIGMSGVGYALFGFGWVTRRHILSFARWLDNRVVLLFILSLEAGFIVTQFGLLNIANSSHLAGLLFGALFAAVWVADRRKWWSVAGLSFLLCFSLVPLFWCPRSPDWATTHVTPLSASK